MLDRPSRATASPACWFFSRMRRPKSFDVPCRKQYTTDVMVTAYTLYASGEQRPLFVDRSPPSLNSSWAPGGCSEGLTSCMQVVIDPTGEKTRRRCGPRVSVTRTTLTSRRRAPHIENLRTLSVSASLSSQSELAVTSTTEVIPAPSRFPLCARLPPRIASWRARANALGNATRALDVAPCSAQHASLACSRPRSRKTFGPCPSEILTQKSSRQKKAKGRRPMMRR
jgi:hypothetical protein